MRRKLGIMIISLACFEVLHIVAVIVTIAQKKKRYEVLIIFHNLCGYDSYIMIRGVKEAHLFIIKKFTIDQTIDSAPRYGKSSPLQRAWINIPASPSLWKIIPQNNC
jgi:hypothetical protein